MQRFEKTYVGYRQRFGRNMNQDYAYNSSSTRTNGIHSRICDLVVNIAAEHVCYESLSSYFFAGVCSGR
jgi:hypothetical protein